ncbi:hypothetical protein CA13_40530 [Planctomycetes bacterium CA13]|uniref:Uncharacterized protein n=2 Tax=Novipirellula herctigrandis TaxID=2527986 RepID=A0A5C5Z5Y5_9BACT|nr:hypothetical protein CA13_40530 [Planctomycetes bacterium CA13]
MMPAPLVASRDSLDERFPCENCPCGCATAEFCWDTCCCFSDEEKLRWASDAGVKPPDFLVDRVNAKNNVSKLSNHCCCCSTGVSTCEVSEPAGTADDMPVASRTKTSVVLFWKAAQCRNLRLMWTLLAQAFVDKDDHHVVAPMEWPMHWLRLSDEFAASRSVSPEPPVP